MKDNRAISIRSYIIKNHHAFTRDKFKAMIGNAIYASQFGGVKNRSSTMAGALVRWTMLACIKLGNCCSVFLGDVKSAYYSILHGLLDSQEFDPASLEDFLERVEIPLAFHEPLFLYMSNPGAIDLTTSDPHI